MATLNYRRLTEKVWAGGGRCCSKEQSNCGGRKKKVLLPQNFVFAFSRRSVFTQPSEEPSLTSST